MSKESSSGQATTCICGGTFAFMEQHWPHCTMNPDNMGSKTHGAGDALLKSLQAKFTKAEIAHIAQYGGKEQIVQKKGAKNKRTKAGAKR